MQQGQHVTPERIWQLMTGFQISAAFKAAVELGIFTSIAEGNTTSEAIAANTGAAERGVRILCDALTVIGLLQKDRGEYSLSADAAVFLDRKSPAYLGSMVNFIMSEPQMEGFADLTQSVRRGGAAKTEHAIDPESPMWQTFARSMAPGMVPAAQALAGFLHHERDAELKVLDIAAGHGLFGITIAQHYPNAEIYALDWRIVLEVAQENADRFGVSDRFHKVEGSAFETEFGSDYDIILITNFLHHFDPEANVAFLRKVHSALKDDGEALTLEFVPNDDRVSPPGEALFSLIMLAGTPSGDAYTFKELSEMLQRAGFSRNEHRPMPGMPQHWIASSK